MPAAAVPAHRPLAYPPESTPSLPLFPITIPQRGTTTLHIAASRRSEGEQIAAVLLRFNADPNALDNAGRVPLTETLPALDSSPDRSRRFSLAAVATLVAGGARLDHPAAGSDLMRGLMREFPTFTEEEEEQLVALIEHHPEDSRIMLREIMNETRLAELQREHVRFLLNSLPCSSLGSFVACRVELPRLRWRGLPGHSSPGVTTSAPII